MHGEWRVWSEDYLETATWIELKVYISCTSCGNKCLLPGILQSPCPPIAALWCMTPSLIDLCISKWCGGSLTTSHHYFPAQRDGYPAMTSLITKDWDRNDTEYFSLFLILYHYCFPLHSKKVQIFLSPPFACNIFVEVFSILFNNWISSWTLALLIFSLHSLTVTLSSSWAACLFFEQPQTPLFCHQIPLFRQTFFLFNMSFSTWRWPVPVPLTLPFWTVSSLSGFLGPSRLPPKWLSQLVSKTYQSLLTGSPRWQLCWPSLYFSSNWELHHFMITEPKMIPNHYVTHWSSLFTNSKSRRASSPAVSLATHSWNLWQCSFSALLHFQQVSRKMKSSTSGRANVRAESVTAV